MADGVELRQGFDLNQSVVIGIEVGRHRHRERQRPTRVRAGCIGGGYGDDGLPLRDRGDRHLRPGNAHRSNGGRRRGSLEGQDVSLSVQEILRYVHDQVPVSHPQRLVLKCTHRLRRLIARAHIHAHRNTALRHDILDQGIHPVGVGRTEGYVAVGVLEPVDILRDDLRVSAVVADQAVGYAWSRVPVALVHRGPGEDHLSLSGRCRRRQDRSVSKLIAKLLPGCLTVSVHVYRQHRILVRCAEVPGIIGCAVAVQVQIPGLKYTRVSRGRL